MRSPGRAQVAQRVTSSASHGQHPVKRVAVLVIPHVQRSQVDLARIARDVRCRDDVPERHLPLHHDGEHGGADLARLLASPLVPDRVGVGGYVYDLGTGLVGRVEHPARSRSAVA